MHADHHGGVVSVLLHREILARKHKVQLSPITLIGNRHLNDYLNDVKESVYDDDFRYIFVDCSELDENKNATVLKSLRESLHLSSLRLVDVVHCASAQALIMERNKNQMRYKLVYSGDCRPSENLIEQGKDALLLIHEATFEGSMKSLAVEKKHTTTDEAIAVGEASRAFLTVLMHFSQRYPCAPPVDSTRSNCVAPAFDLLKLNLKDSWMLPRLNKVYQLIFEEDMEEDEERTLEFLDHHEDLEEEDKGHIACRFYAMGRCTSKDCPFYHDPEMPYIECRWGKECPFGLQCWFRHSSTD